MGRGAELGILIKNGEALERSEKLTVVACDKTGTLTTGKPEVTDIVPAADGAGGDAGRDAVDPSRLLALAAAVERYSQHPLAAAIAAAAAERGVAVPEGADPETFAGKGVTAKIDGQEAAAGSRAFLAERGVALTADMEAKAAAFEGEGKTVVAVGLDGRPAGLVAIADTLKATTPEAVAAFKRLGLKVVMVTGDNAEDRRRSRAKGGHRGRGRGRPAPGQGR